MDNFQCYLSTINLFLETSVFPLLRSQKYIHSRFFGFEMPVRFLNGCQCTEGWGDQIHLEGN